MDKGYITSLIINGGGLTIIFYVLNRVWNREKWQKMWIRIGKGLTNLGRLRVGKKIWEKTEDLLEDRMRLAVNGLITGWNYDNNKNEK